MTSRGVTSAESPAVVLMLSASSVFASQAERARRSLKTNQSCGYNPPLPLLLTAVPPARGETRDPHSFSIFSSKMVRCPTLAGTGLKEFVVALFPGVTP